MAMSYSRRLLSIAVAQICQQLGWDTINSTSLELLTCILENYVYEVGLQTHRYCELYGRTQPNLNDLGLAFCELHVSLNELLEYVNHIDALSYAMDVLQFPAKKMCHLWYNQDYKTELRSDDALSFAEIEDGCCSPWLVKHDSSLTGRSLSVISIHGDKRLPGSVIPSENLTTVKKSRVLPDEAAHSQYEMKSFIKSDTGILYPTGQGKLADAHNVFFDESFTDGKTVQDRDSRDDFLPKQLLSKHSKDKGKSCGGAVANDAAKYDSLLPLEGCSNPTVPSKRFNKTESDLHMKNISNDSDVLDLREVSDGDMRARETRLTAYEDAIDSVIRKVQEIDNLVGTDYDDRVVTDYCEPSDTGKTEREARISDTIDAVIAQSACVSQEISCIRDTSPDEITVSNSEDRTVVAPVCVGKASPNAITVAAKNDGTAVNTVGSLVIAKRSKVKQDRRKISKGNLSLRICTTDTDITKPEELFAPDNDCKNSAVKKSKNHWNGNDVREPDEETASTFHCNDIESNEFDDSRLPMVAAVSLMELAGVVPLPPQKRLRITYGSGKDRTVENKSANNVESCDRLKGSAVELQHVENSNTRGVFEESRKDIFDNNELKHEGKKTRKHASKCPEKLSSTLDKDKKKSLTVPKMTIKFGGGSSGGAVNSVSVNAFEKEKDLSNIESQTPLKLVIRSLAMDDKTMSTSTNALSQSTKKIRHRPSLSVSAQSSGVSLSKVKSENKNSLSPVRFTSSSSSSGSPYSEEIRTPTPPSLSLPLPRTPRSAVRSSSQSDFSFSRSPSPPTLYCSPDVDEQHYAGTPLNSLPNFNSAHIQTSTVQPVASGFSGFPSLPPPTSKTGISHRASRAKQLIVTETVSKIVDESGEITWICPACKMPDDGSPMIGCDICDDWYHWPCVGITKEPPDEEQWFCKRCAESNCLSSTSKQAKGSKRRSVTAKLRPKKPVRKR